MLLKFCGQVTGEIKLAPFSGVFLGEGGGGGGLIDVRVAEA